MSTLKVRIGSKAVKEKRLNWLTSRHRAVCKRKYLSPFVHNNWLMVWNNFIFFHNMWDNPSHWLIFFKMVKTTNQIRVISVLSYLIAVENINGGYKFFFLQVAVGGAPFCINWYLVLFLSGSIWLNLTPLRFRHVLFPFSAHMRNGDLTLCWDIRVTHSHGDKPINLALCFYEHNATATGSETRGGDTFTKSSTSRQITCFF